MKTHLHTAKLPTLSLLAGLVTLAGCSASESKDTSGNNRAVEQTQQQQSLAIWPKLNNVVRADPQIESKIAQYLQTMTLEQKVAQMIQP